MSRFNRYTVAFCSLILCTVFAARIGVPIRAEAQTQRQNKPSLKETLRWMQTTLEDGGGDYSVGHEVRSVRLVDFVGCKVHFSASTHQEPFLNGEPAPDKKPWHVDYYFELGDIDPNNMPFTKGPRLTLDTRSLVTIRTRNEEKKITIKLEFESEADAKPDSTFVIFSLDALGDNDYVVAFTKAFKHAVEACGGKPSFFADSNGRDEDERAPVASAGVAPQSAPSRKGTQPASSTLPDISQFVAQPRPSTAAHSVPSRKDIPAIAKAANGAIVSIVMSDNAGKPIAKGTGFLVSKDGRIVTNYHVISEGYSAIVKLPEGAFFEVDGVLASDKHRDIAVIKAHGENFRTLTLGNSDRLQVGEEVVAIGNPLSLESTVSNGIVSGIRTAEEEGGKFLQVTTPISPGSSGGPLFNMAGEVVGITTMYLEGGENLNFAIPINDAKRLLLSKSSSLLALPNEPEPVKAQTRRQTPPEARDNLQWMQDSLDAGGADQIDDRGQKKSVRLIDFSGCRVHFANIATRDGKETFVSEPTFNLDDIDPTTVSLGKADQDFPHEYIFIAYTVNRANKIVWKVNGEDKTNSFVMLNFPVAKYSFRFMGAFRHAVEVCSGKMP